MLEYLADNGRIHDLDCLSKAYNDNYNEACVMNELFTKHGNHRIQKINDFEFRLEKNEKKGMNLPVTFFSDDILISKMVSDRTINQAANVATLPGVKKHIVVLPDGHEGYGFPVGGVAATDLVDGVISPRRSRIRH